MVICSVTHNTIAMDGRHDLFLSVPTAHKHDPPYSTIPDRHYWPRDVTWRCYFKVDRRTDLTIGYIKIMFARQVMLFFIAIAAVIPVNTDSVKLKHLYYRQR